MNVQLVLTLKTAQLVQTAFAELAEVTKTALNVAEKAFAKPQRRITLLKV